MSYSAAILTISTKGATGEREDSSGATIREILESGGFAITRYEIVTDSQAEIAKRLRLWSDGAETVQLIVTTGGTGLSPRDVTPEAMRELLDYEVPGIAEAMRAEGLKHTPMSMISRALAGVRNKTLIINLPGSPKAVRENLAVVLPILPHALDLLAGGGSDHPL